MNYRCQSCGTVLPTQQPPEQTNPYQQNPYQQTPYQPGGFNQTPYYGDRPAPPFPKPSTNLVGGILLCVLCGCIGIIFGILAIVNASKVDSAWAEGRWDDAVRHSKNAATFTWIGFAVGAVVGILYVIVMVAAEGM
jgi:hypothetical protein